MTSQQIQQEICQQLQEVQGTGRCYGQKAAAAANDDQQQPLPKRTKTVAEQLEVFATVRDTTIYAPRGGTSMHEFIFIRRAIVSREEHIRNHFMSHIFRYFVGYVITYASCHKVIPRGILPGGIISRGCNTEIINKMVRGKRIESSDVPSVIELPRISYHNVGASLDIQLLHQP